MIDLDSLTRYELGTREFILEHVAVSRLCFVPCFLECDFENPFQRVLACDLIRQEDVLGLLQNLSFELATQDRRHDHGMQAIALQATVSSMQAASCCTEYNEVQGFSSSQKMSRVGNVF